MTEQALHLVNYGVAIPPFRLNTRPGTSEHSVQYWDQDPITLAYDASQHSLCDKFHQEIDALLFATTSPVFKNRTHSSFLARLLGLKEEILTLDFLSSPKSGTDALLVAFALLQSGQFSTILVAVADSHFSLPGENPYPPHGHGASALLLSTKIEGMGMFLGHKSRSSFLAESSEYNSIPQVPDPRFLLQNNLKPALKTAVEEFLAENGMDARSFDCCILNSMHQRRLLGIFKNAGFSKDSMGHDSLLANLGHSDCSHAILKMVEALESGAQEILCVDVHNGMNLIHLRAKLTNIKEKKKLLSEQLQARIELEDRDYLKLYRSQNPAPGVSVHEVFSSEIMLEREHEQVLHLKGYSCVKCRTVWSLKTNRCKHCGCSEFDIQALAKAGLIFSFTREEYFPTPFPPLGMAVIDLEGGGRMTLQVTDEIKPGPLKVGAKVELVLRRLIAMDRKPNYLWKCRLV